MDIIASDCHNMTDRRCRMKECREYIAKKYNLPMVSIGDVVRELAAKDGLELTRENLHATSKKYMDAYGQTAHPEFSGSDPDSAG